jgi:hypothetical protein
MRLHHFLALGALLFGFAALPARGDTVTYNFTYNGTGTYDPTLSVVGSGSLTATFTEGSAAGTVTSFSFMDTFTSTTNGDSTFSYSSATGSINFSKTAPYGIANVSLTTPYVAGSNPSYKMVDFTLNYSGVTFDSTAGSTGTFLADFSSGGGTITLAPATPEPSSLLLFGSGLLGFAGIIRRKLTK